MYLFHEDTPVTDMRCAQVHDDEVCEHWAEGAYALFVAHQFKVWPSAWVNWADAPRSNLLESDTAP